VFILEEMVIGEGWVQVGTPINSKTEALARFNEYVYNNEHVRLTYRKASAS
jgi:hypothetical protein